MDPRGDLALSLTTEKMGYRLVNDLSLFQVKRSPKKAREQRVEVVKSRRTQHS